MAKYVYCSLCDGYHPIGGECRSIAPNGGATAAVKFDDPDGVEYDS